MSWDEGLKLIAAFLQAGSILATALFAIAGLDAWRRQMVGKRKMEVAESLLAVSYRFRDRISWVRHPGSFGGEGDDRTKEPDETPDITRARNTYYVPIARLKRNEDILNDLAKSGGLARVYFGAEAVAALHEFRAVTNDVVHCAWMLISAVGDEVDQRRREKWQAVIWEGASDQKPDPIAACVDAALEQIVSLCQASVAIPPPPRLLRWLFRRLGLEA